MAELVCRKAGGAIGAIDCSTNRTDSYPRTGLGRAGSRGLPGEPFLAAKPPSSLETAGSVSPSWRLQRSGPILTTRYEIYFLQFFSILDEFLC